MSQAARKACVAVAACFRRYPWIGWAGWALFVAVALARTHPRRFASTFTYYLLAAERLASGGQVYDPDKLGDFVYLPLTLLLYVPFTWISRVPAAAIAMILGAALFSYACVRLTRALLAPGTRNGDAAALAGLVLLINIPAVWFNLKAVQAQVPMTAAMMAACAAMVHARWRAASLWLLVAVAMKPLALVMLLLCAALVREMRWLLVAALAVLLLAPFAFLEWDYLAAQHQALALKLWHIATAPLEEWPYQADLSTLLRALGIKLPPPIALGLRLAVALGTLAVAWRVRQDGSIRGFAFAALLLSGCYITLLGPRNEFLSFVVLTPALTFLAVLLLVRRAEDWRGWLLIAAALLLGFSVNLATDAVVKPAIVLIIYVWLIRLMLVPGRWRVLLEGEGAAPAPDR
jgi:hypothetical protein